MTSLYVLIGMFILTLIGFILIYLFQLAYYRLIRKNTTHKLLVNSLFLTISNSVVNFLTLALFSFNIYLYCALSFIFLIAAFYFILRYRKVAKTDSLIVAGGLAFVLNPAWLRFLGII